MPFIYLIVGIIFKGNALRYPELTNSTLVACYGQSFVEKQKGLNPLIYSLAGEGESLNQALILYFRWRSTPRPMPPSSLINM